MCDIFNCELNYILCQQDKKVISEPEVITLRKLLDTIYHKEQVIIANGKYVLQESVPPKYVNNEYLDCIVNDIKVVEYLTERDAILIDIIL